MDNLKISAVNNFDHKNLVNNPPFIENHPLFYKLENQKLENKKIANAIAQTEFTKEKCTNGIIWSILIAIPLILIYFGHKVYKTISTYIRK